MPLSNLEIKNAFDSPDFKRVHALAAELITKTCDDPDELGQITLAFRTFYMAALAYFVFTKNQFDYKTQHEFICYIAEHETGVIHNELHEILNRFQNDNISKNTKQRIEALRFDVKRADA